MDSPRYKVSYSTTTDVNTEIYEVKDVYFCHNCGIKDGPLRSISLFGLEFYLCDSCYEEFQKRQQQHSCPALNPDWYK